MRPQFSAGLGLVRILKEKILALADVIPYRAPNSRQGTGIGGGVGNLCCAQGVGNLCCARGVGGEGEKVVLAACLRSGPEDLEDRNAIRGVRGFCG